MKDEHQRDKQTIKALIKKLNLPISNELSFKEFNSTLSTQEEYNKLSESSRNFYYSYFIEKAKSK